MRELALRLQDVMEVGAIDEGHRNELRPSNIAQIVNAENVPVRNLAGQQQLLLEALHGFRMNHQFGADKFERDGAVQIQIVGLVDSTHASLAEKLFDTVAGTKINFGTGLGAGTAYANCGWKISGAACERRTRRSVGVGRHRRRTRR